MANGVLAFCDHVLVPVPVPVPVHDHDPDLVLVRLNCARQPLDAVAVRLETAMGMRVPALDYLETCFVAHGMVEIQAERMVAVRETLKMDLVVLSWLMVFVRVQHCRPLNRPIQTLIANYYYCCDCCCYYYCYYDYSNDDGVAPVLTVCPASNRKSVYASTTMSPC